MVVRLPDTAEHNRQTVHATVQQDNSNSRESSYNTVMVIEIPTFVVTQQV